MASGLHGKKTNNVPEVQNNVNLVFCEILEQEANRIRRGFLEEMRPYTSIPDPQLFASGTLWACPVSAATVIGEPLNPTKGLLSCEGEW